ncbi:MAG: 4Fe-4S binding protein [Sphaerochaetaceae bacterium]|nr:4Fe-4S binding protein [Sphaerochaetaceae bacterium]
MKKVLVISGKGGTGKTTISSTLIDLLNVKALADCDVDAPNLHLVSSFDSNFVDEKPFEGMDIFKIDESKCIGCGKCEEVCKFSSIKKINNVYRIDPLACEGCSVCQYFCPANAISNVKNIVGQSQVFKGEKVFSTAKLSMGSGNSGKLVSQVKKNLDDSIENSKLHDIAIIDGSPGIGCPVIASLSAIDLAIVVTEPSLSGLSDLKRIIKTAKIFKTKVAVIINKANLNESVKNKIINFIESENLIYLGNVDYDSDVSKIINNSKSLANMNTKASNDLKCISNKLLLELQK